MQKKQIPSSDSPIEFTDSVRARIVSSFRRAYEFVDKHRDIIETVVEVLGDAVEVLAIVFGIDLDSVSLITELLELAWDLANNPRVRAAVTAAVGWLRRLLHRGAAAVHRAHAATAAGVRAGVRRARRGYIRLRRRVRASARRVARVLFICY